MSVNILKPEIHAIIFDLDDTLIDSERIYETLYKELALDETVFKEARQVVKSTLSPNHVAARNRLLYFKKYLELKQQFSVETLLRLVSVYEERMQVLIEANLTVTGHRTLLKKLAARFRLGIVTNENLRTQMLKISMIDPHQDLFSFILTSEEIGVEKPDPAIIDRAILLSQASPKNIVAIGDSINKDLLSFQKKGCSVIGTRQFRDESSSQSNNLVWVNRLDEILVE